MWYFQCSGLEHSLSQPGHLGKQWMTFFFLMQDIKYLLPIFSWTRMSENCHPSSVEISPTMPSSIEQVLCLLFLHRGLHRRRLVAAASVSIYSLGDGDCWAKDTRGTKIFKHFFVRNSITESHVPVEGNCSVHCPTGSPSYSRRCCTPRSLGNIITLNKDCQCYATQSQCCTSLAW